MNIEYLLLFGCNHHNEGSAGSLLKTSGCVIIKLKPDPQVLKSSPNLAKKRGSPKPDQSLFCIFRLKPTSIWVGPACWDSLLSVCLCERERKGERRDNVLHNSQTCLHYTMALIPYKSKIIFTACYINQAKNKLLWMLIPVKSSALFPFL